MKFALILIASAMAFNVSAKSLTCTASLSSTKLDEERFFQGLESAPVAVDTRSISLDQKGDAELAGIIIDSYEKHGISYNYAAYAKNGFITYLGAENEVLHSGSGVSKLKNQTEVDFGSSSTEDGSALDVHCEIK